MGTASAAPYALELEGVHKSFGDLPVLRGVDLHVRERQTVVLLGVSGSGKTVLLKHALGLLQPDRGVVRVEGKDLRALGELELQELRRDIGVLFQASALFDSMTAFENVAFPLKERDRLSGDEITQRVRETLALVGLSQAERLYPGELSGGMKKRLAFARALAPRPRILLCDEPTAGLDPLTTESVVQALAVAKKGGLTSLIITPDLPSAMFLADELAFLHEGRILVQAPPAELLQSPLPEVQAFVHDYVEREHLHHRSGAGARPPP